MSASHGSGGVDIVRKGGVVVLLLAGLVLLHRFVGTPTEAIDPRGLLALGFVVLAAHAIGELAEVFKLPHITGYLLAGLVLGPSAAHELGQLLPGGLLPAPFDNGVLNEAVIGQLGVLDTLALPLICLTAGGELDLPQIRKGLKVILSLLLGQVVVLVLVFVGFTWAISGAIPAIALPALEGVNGAGVFALGGVLASLALATSAAATIAIIVGTGSKGPLTTNVLSVVVMKDVTVVVMFAAFTALAAGLLGSGEGTSFSTSLLYIAESVVLGVVVGGLIHLYMRFVNAELLLFLVGLIFAVVYVCGVLHAEVALVFITAGFVMGNFSKFGHDIIHQVERLSLPVYVVFFTLAGARLHLDVVVQMAGFALALVTLRTAGVWVGTRLGAVVAGADEKTTKYGWLGMISQAGLSISLAAQLPALFPGTLGDGLFALVLAGVAVHEVVGPAMLQWGLGRAGETQAQREAEQEAPVEGTAEPRADEPEGQVGDPWGPPMSSSSPALVQATDLLREELSRVVEEWVHSVVGPSAARDEAWLADLRREHLRLHRRSLALLRGGEAATDKLAQGFDQMCLRWRESALARAPQPGLTDWNTQGLMRALDALVDGLEQTVDAPVEPETLQARPEPAWRSVRRRLLRQRARFGTLRRRVAVRDLARYHFSGLAVGHLEGLVALRVRAELELCDQLTEALDEATQQYAKLIRGLTAGELDAAKAEEAIWQLRTVLDEKLALAAKVVQGLRDDARGRATSVVGSALVRLKDELGRSGTMDLPYRARRMGRVYAQRNRGVFASTQGFDQALGTLSARYHAMALEIEVANLEVDVAHAVERGGRAMQRQSEELGLRQLVRANERAREAVRAFERILDEEDQTAAQIATRLRQEGIAARRQLEESHRLLDHLANQFSGDRAVAGMRDALAQACARLTDVYVVPSRALRVGSWSLDSAVPTTEMRLRELGIAYVETNVARALQGRVTAHLAQYADARGLLADLERVLVFNLDLAVADLDQLRDQRPSEDVSELVRGMLLGAVERSRVRLADAIAPLDAGPDELRASVSAEVHHALFQLRQLATSGEVSELRRRLLREAVANRAALGRLDVAGLRLDLDQHLLDGLVGPRRHRQLRRWLGLPVRASAADFSPPTPSVDLPMLYRRLFSDQALVGSSAAGFVDGDLADASKALERGRTAVAVVTPSKAESAALAAGCWPRAAGGAPRRLVLKSEVTLEQVDGLFTDQPTELRGLEWLFSLRPGGARPLERFVERLLESQAPWVLVADDAVWDAACALAPLQHAMGRVVRPPRLSPSQLQQAVLGRHEMSAYALEIAEDDALSWVTRLRHGESGRQQAWFEDLHAATDGVLSDALRLWLASIVGLDEESGTLRVGVIPSLPRDGACALDDHELLTLRHALRLGRLTDRDHASAFGCGVVDSRALLQNLADRGLLERDEGALVVAEHLRTSVQYALRVRGWSE